jgi:hypothetical protein
MNNEIEPWTVNTANSIATEGQRATKAEAASQASLTQINSPARLEAKGSCDTKSPETRQPIGTDEEKLSEMGSPLADSHAFSDLDCADLPSYVRDHNSTLTFPEKVTLGV